MKKIIGLVGETGAGKDTFYQFLKKIFSPVFCLHFSQPLTEMLRIFFNEIKKEDQQWLATALRKRFGNNILGEAIAKKIKSINKGLIIVNGIRMWEEFELIKKLGGKIVYITADSKTRWQRTRKRGEKKDDLISYKKFLKLEKARTETLVSKIGQKADFRIENNGPKRIFYQKIKETINKF